MTHSLFWVEAYEVMVGLFTAIGGLYLMYMQRRVAVFGRFLYYLVIAFVLFALGGPVTHILATDWVHAVHGLAALFAVFALYNPVRNDLRTDAWAQLIFTEPRVARAPEEWMTPMDDDVLELFHTTGLILTPAVIADNLEYSRGEVNRRLSTLTDHGFVRKVDRGKYRLTDAGEQYLHGE